nr:Tn3 family transposase [Nocardia cyriacigeorgica]
MVSDPATNAVIAWTTEYYGLAVEQMRRAGHRIDDEVLAHISPAHSANINFFGAIEVDIDAELAALGPTATGRCGCVTPCSDRSRRYPRARFVCSRPSHSVVVISGIRSAQDRPSCVQSWSQARG